MIILSLLERDPSRLRTAILSAPQKADAVEVRLDALKRLDYAVLRSLFGGSPRPIIASCRRVRDGGFFRGSESLRKEILWSALRAGTDFLDLEFGSEVVSLAQRVSPHADIGIIVSWHDPKRMPDEPMKLYRKMSKVPNVTAVKIIGTARSVSDVLEVKRFLGRAAGKAPKVISFAMGETGRLSRIMATEWGSWATYANPGNGRSTAPGQFSLPDLVGTYRVEEIDGETRFAGIIGNPLRHSLSPVIHNAAFKAHGLNYRYLPLEFPQQKELSRLKSILKELRIRGVSVTIPYKVKVMPYLDLVEPLAAQVGAVNTIINDGRRLVGFNTDATGGYAVLLEALHGMKLRIDELTSVVVGSGGVARALAYAVSRGGSEVIVSSRTESRGRALARLVGGRWVAPARLSRASYDVLINCTPVGMSGNGRTRGTNLPVTPAAIKGRLVYDVVTTPGSTPLLDAARGRGIATLGGREMLVQQAAEQFQIFSGRNAPLEMMREALTQELFDHPGPG